MRPHRRRCGTGLHVSTWPVRWRQCNQLIRSARDTSPLRLQAGSLLCCLAPAPSGPTIQGGCQKHVCRLCPHTQGSYFPRCCMSACIFLVLRVPRWSGCATCGATAVHNHCYQAAVDPPCWVWLSVTQRTWGNDEPESGQIKDVGVTEHRSTVPTSSPYEHEPRREQDC